MARSEVAGVGSMRHGFALVTSLLVMVVVAALGAGAVFLTQMNLRIAENTRAQAIAKANAEGGLERAFVALATYVTENGTTLPSSVPDLTGVLADSPFWIDDTGYALVPTTFVHSPGTGGEDGDMLRLAVRGTGPRNALHEVEALVQAVERATRGGGGSMGLGDGFTAEGDIDLNGNGTYDINFLSGSNIDIAPGTLVVGRTAVAEGSCRFGAPPTRCGENSEEEVIVEAPVFSDVRDLIIENREERGVDMDACFAAPVTSIPPNATGVYCLATGSNVTISGNVSGLTVIGDETTSVAITAQSGDPNDPNVPGLTVVSGTVTFPTSDSPFYGYNTIVAVNDIEFGKDVVSNDQTARSLFITEGNFRLNGTGATDIFASFWVGGDFRWNGTPDRFRGTILAKGRITGNGCGVFCNVAPPDDLDFEVDPNAGGGSITSRGINVLSRR